MHFDAKLFLDKFISRLPEGHTITGLTVEISRPAAENFIIRCNGGTYKELAESFPGDMDAFVDDIISGYTKASKIADEQFASVISEYKGKPNDAGSTPSGGESAPPASL